MVAKQRRLGLCLILGLLACQPEATTPLPSPLPSTAPTLTPTPSVSTSPTPAMPEPSPVVTPAPVSTPSPEITTAPTSAPTPDPEMVFLPLGEKDLADVQLYLGFTIGEENISATEEESILNDIFNKNPEDLEALLGLETTVQAPGPLYYEANGEFATTAVKLDGPRAWQRTRKLVEQRVRVKRRTDNGQMSLWLVREFEGQLRLDLDGSSNDSTPQTKPLRERFVQRFVVSRPKDQWVIVQTSHAVTLPSQPQNLRLPLIRNLTITRSDTGLQLFRVQQPLQTFERLIIPPLNSRTKIRISAEILSRDDTYSPREFVYIHAFGERKPMFDDGRFGDQKSNDQIYSLEMTTPDSLDGIFHLGVDTLSAQTFSDETTPNYQGMAWILHFRGVNPL